MAGGQNTGKINPKTFNLFGNNKSNEILSDTPQNLAPKKFSLSGILGLNQTVEINKTPNTKNWGQEFFGNISPIQQENSLLNQQQIEQEKIITSLRGEIKKIASANDNLEKDVQNIGLEYIPEVSEYQVNFFTRIRNYVTKNINEASSWLESFSQKKRKKNYFWSMAKSKKGGEQYLNSGEHSASRSVN